jgi:hypothetical protein
MTTERTVARSGKSKRKPFNSNVADHLRIIATFAFSYPLVLSETSRHLTYAYALLPLSPGVRFNAFAIFLAPVFCKSGFIFQICASGAAAQASHPATIKLTHYRAFRPDV